MVKHAPHTPAAWITRIPWPAIVVGLVASTLLVYGGLGSVPHSPPRLGGEAGLHTNPIQVGITANEPNVEIYYTTDGSVPTRNRGTRYTEPVPIVASTVIRAVAIQPWIGDSPVATASYLFPETTAGQSADPPGFPGDWRGHHLELDRMQEVVPDYGMNTTLPRKAVVDALRALRTVSLVIAPEDLFDQATGLYVNATQRGPAWERPVSIEVFDVGGQRILQADAGVRVNGLTGRKLDRNPKLGFRVLFRERYGAGELQFPVFGPTGRQRFDALVLRNMTQDSWVYPGKKGMGPAHYIRDQFARETQGAMGHPYIMGEFVHLYLNGLYWGIYNLCERVDGSFLSDHFGGHKHDYDLINADTADLGSRDAWQRVADLSSDLAAHPSNYETLEAMVDLDSLIDFVLINHFIDNIDWFLANWLAAKRRSPNGQFVFIVYDAEVSFESRQAHMDFLDLDELVRRGNFFSPLHLFHRLQRHPEFQLRFADRVQRHYFNGGALSLENAQQRWRTIARGLEPAIVAESARWGDSNVENILRTRVDDWRPHIDQIEEQFFAQRTARLLAHYRDTRLISPIPAPAFVPHGGTVTPGTAVTINANDGSVYYSLDGEDPRNTSGSVNEEHAQAYTTPIRMDSPCTVKARVFDGTQWSALTEAHFDVSPISSN